MQSYKKLAIWTELNPLKVLSTLFLVSKRNFLVKFSFKFSEIINDFSEF